MRSRGPNGGLDPDLSQRARSALEIIGIYSQQALKRALIHTQREEAAHTPLTPREREIMQWVAIGKSDEYETPVTYILPCASIAIERPISCVDPPRKVP